MVRKKCDELVCSLSVQFWFSILQEERDSQLVEDATSMTSTLSGGRGLHNQNNCINLIVFPIVEGWDIIRGKYNLADVIYGGSLKPMLGDNELREQDKGLQSEPAIVL